jgi:hypothetical protein
MILKRLMCRVLRVRVRERGRDCTGMIHGN